MANVDNFLKKNNTLTPENLASNTWTRIFLKTKQNNM